MTTSDIKNLSIALEALSRIPNVSDFSTRIQGLLIEAIDEVEKANKVEEPPVYSRPPKVPYRPSTSSLPKLDNDDIPF